MNLVNLPKHKKCENCGECCGIVPVNEKELKTIENYCIKNKIKPISTLNPMSCPFRDNKAKKCLIYPVRPLLCKMFGVTEGMNCPKGNSANINGHILLKKDGGNKNLLGLVILANKLK